MKQVKTDKRVTSNRPDIVIMDKKEKSLKLIDVSIPNDMNIVSKRIEKSKNMPTSVSN